MKHMPDADDMEVMMLHAREPEWWKGPSHAVPGSRYLVQEGDWGSIIAATLA